jgi:integrase
LAEVYVLLLGIAGGRPGECAGVDTGDLELMSEESEVTFRRTSRRSIDKSFLDPDDDADWGPLKGREIEASRTAPIPIRDAHRIHELLADTSVTGALFPGWDPEKFRRDAWDPAKAELAARCRHRAKAGSMKRKDADVLSAALRRLRLQDLRHAACSMWLNTPGIEVKVACEWSGHKRLSVFLDIYQGVMPGAKSSAAAKLNSAW